MHGIEETKCHLNIHVYDLKISKEFIKAFVTTLPGIIQGIIHCFSFLRVNDPRLIQKFQELFHSPSAVYIPNLTFIPYFFITFKFSSLASHIPKKVRVSRT